MCPPGGTPSRSRLTWCSHSGRRPSRGEFDVRPVSSVATAQARKQAAPSERFQFATRGAIDELVEGTTKPATGEIAEEDATEQVDPWFLPSRPVARVASHAGARRGRRSCPRRETRAIRAYPAPNELVVGGVVQRRVHGSTGHVEAQGAGGLDRRGLPRRRPAVRRMTLGKRERGLHGPTSGQQDRADEERDRVSPPANEARVARERGAQKAGRTAGEEERHPALTSHDHT